MKSLIVLVVGLLSVGCGKTEPMGSGNEYNAELAIDQNTTKAKPVRELTLEEKVVGEYEFRDRWNTYKYILLYDGYYDYYRNGKKTGGSIWTIANGEIHVNYDSGVIGIYRLNPDKSITYIGTIRDNKRYNTKIGSIK